MKPCKSDIIVLCNRLFFVMAIFVINTSYCLSQNSRFTVSSSSFLSPPREKISRSEARNSIINEDFIGAAKIYSGLLAMDSLNMSLIVESSYALALNGYFEGALMRLDRLWILGMPAEKNDLFLINQILLLSGAENIRKYFIKDKLKVKEPKWLSGRSVKFLDQYKRINPALPFGSCGSEKDLFLKANILVNNREYFQAVYLFDYLTNANAENIAYRMGYITALEKIGLIDAAKSMLNNLVAGLRKGNAMGDNISYLDGSKKVENSTIGILENHMNHLEKPFLLYGQNLFQTSKPQTMVYYGMMIAPSYLNLSGKLGYFLSESTNASFDISLNKSADIKTFNTGITMYERRDKIIYGLGLTFSAGQAKSLLYKVSVGYSIPNKKRTSSFDIFCDINLGLTKDAPGIIGLSIGKSFYFGKRKVK